MLLSGTQNKPRKKQEKWEREKAMARVGVTKKGGKEVRIKDG